jgi:hypothetical protein
MLPLDTVAKVEREYLALPGVWEWKPQCYCPSIAEVCFVHRLRRVQPACLIVLSQKGVESKFSRWAARVKRVSPQMRDWKDWE